jgi:HK97 family phage major capsid protein
MKLADIQARLVEIADEMEAISAIAADESRELSDADNDQILALSEEFDVLKASKEKAEKVQAKMASIVEARATAQEPQAGVQPMAEETPAEKPESSMIPAKAKYNKSNVFASSEDAYTAGMYLAAIGGDQKAHEFMAAQSVGTDNKGGFTVPTPLASELINLIEEYGVARNVCRRVVMGALTWSVPKVAGHSTIYYPAEAASITESDMTFSQLTLTAKKMAALVKMSTEVAEDSVISMTDTIVRDIAWGMAKAEDENLFVGGSIYTGGIEGDAGVADTNVASVGALALTDLTAVVVAAGQERGLTHEWYMSPTLWNGQVRDLLNAAGGNSHFDVSAGARPSLFGYPVNLVNAIPGAAATTGDLLAVFGDLGVSHYFGDRRALNFNVLNELFAVNDQVGIICTQRIDIASANPEVLSKLTVA